MPPVESGGAGTNRYDETSADGEVDLISKYLESGSKPGPRMFFGAPKAHLQRAAKIVILICRMPKRVFVGAGAAVVGIVVATRVCKESC